MPRVDPNAITSNGGRRRKAAVIGSGFGGLAVAIRLQTAGFQTTIFEAHDQPGGRAAVFHDSGYTFDMGPTVITAPHCLAELWSEAGKRMQDYVQLLPVTPFYRLIWDDGDSFDYTGDGTAMVESIRKRNPADAEGYLRFVEYSKRVFEKGYVELAATPFLRFSDMLRVAPQLARLRADRSVYATVSRFIQDEHLRQAFSFHTLLVGGNPFETSSIYTLIHYLERHWGVFFPRGGTSALIRALVRLFEELGGRLALSTPVERVRVLRNGRTQHRVVTAQGEHDFDLVVSNADLHHTYKKLFRDEPAAQRSVQKLESLDWSMSLFVLYFGTNRTYRDQVAHHTVLFGPRYKELLQDIFHGATLPDDFSLYLHAPTVTDPSLAPEGCDSFYVLSPVPHLGHAPIDWEKMAPIYAERILAALETQLPDLRKHVVVQHYRTPETFRDQLNAYQGSAFSAAPNLTQSAWFRPHNRDPHIPGLYLVGAGTHPGAGVPGVVNSAKATASIILEDFPR
jgi:phytoene desaturase